MARPLATRRRLHDPGALLDPLLLRLLLAVPDGHRKAVLAPRVHLVVDVVARGAHERVQVALAHGEGDAADAHLPAEVRADQGRSEGRSEGEGGRSLGRG